MCRPLINMPLQLARARLPETILPDKYRKVRRRPSFPSACNSTHVSAKGWQGSPHWGSRVPRGGLRGVDGLVVLVPFLVTVAGGGGTELRASEGMVCAALAVMVKETSTLVKVRSQEITLVFDCTQ